MNYSRREFSLAAATALLAPRLSLADSRTKPVAAAHTGSDPRERTRIRELLENWIDNRRQCLGVSVCLVTPSGELEEAHGVLGVSDARQVNSGTVFGIASLTKVFTGLLLADAVQRKELALAEPVHACLPNGTKVPSYRSRQISLLDLATQTTGLPQEIPNHTAAAESIGLDPNKPLFDFLAGHELTQPIGEKWSYSNLNYALIGLALEHRTGRSYEQLIRERIAIPLRMHSTVVTLNPELKARRAIPHLDAITPAPEWNKPWSLGAGCLQSTSSDLGRFLSSAMGLRDNVLSKSFEAMLATSRPAPFLGGEQAIGWAVDRSSGDPRVFFAGRAPGFTSSMMFDPKLRRGVVALSNSSLMIEALGREILRPGSTVSENASDGSAIAADPALDRLVGRYALIEPHRDANFSVGDIVAITRIPGGIAISMPRYPTTPLKSLGDGSFGIEGFPVRYVFGPGEGAALNISLTINGKTIGAERSEE